MSIFEDSSDLAGYHFEEVWVVGETDPHNPNESKGGHVFRLQDTETAKKIASILETTVAKRLALIAKDGKLGPLFNRCLEGRGRIYSAEEGEKVAKRAVLTQLSDVQRKILGV